MFDIGLIRGAAIYLAERKASLGRVENAREILGAAVSRSMALFQTLPLVNPSSDGFDVFDLLAHLHRHGEQDAAGRSLDQFLDYVEASVSGYEGGLLLGEGARRLGEWGSQAPRELPLIAPDVSRDVSHCGMKWSTIRAS